jgi:LL-diaminopimelate aminotransferase
VHALQELGIEPEIPKASLYLWSETPGQMESVRFSTRLIEEAGVLITPGIGFGPAGEGHFRISLTTPDDRLDEALHRIGGIDF